MVRIPTGSTFARCLAVSVLAVAATSTLALAQAQDSAQQGCINAMNGSGAKVAATQGKYDSGCIKSAGANSLINPTVDACFTADNKGKVASSESKVTSAQSSKCTEAPDFG